MRAMNTSAKNKLNLLLLMIGIGTLLHSAVVKADDLVIKKGESVVTE